MLICGPSSNKLYGWTCFETPVSILCPECKAAILVVCEASRLNFNYVLFEEDSQLTLKAINQEIHQDWEIVNIILDIRIMLNSFVAWYFSPPQDNLILLLIIYLIGQHLVMLGVYSHFII